MEFLWVHREPDDGSAPSCEEEYEEPLLI